MTSERDNPDDWAHEALENDKTRVMILRTESRFNEETRDYDEYEVEVGLGRSKWFRDFVEKMRTAVPGDNDFSIDHEQHMEYVYQEYHYLRDNMRALGERQVKETPVGEGVSTTDLLYGVTPPRDGSEANPNLNEARALKRLWEEWVGPFQEMQRAMRRLEQVNKRCCPECGSDLTGYDGESEADGCAQDWAEWLYWSAWFEETECEWSDSGQTLVRSGGSF